MLEHCQTNGELTIMCKEKYGTLGRFVVPVGQDSEFACCSLPRPVFDDYDRHISEINPDTNQSIGDIKFICGR